MRKTRLSKVLALTLVFLMVMSTTVFGAVPGTRISNILKVNLTVVSKNYGVVAEDFTTHPNSGVKGYNVGYHLENASMENVKSMEVSIYKDNTELMKNTAIMTKFKSTVPGDDPKASCPFDVFGIFDYASDGYWSKGTWNSTVSELTAPNKAVIKVTYDDDKVVTVENNKFTGTMSEIIPAELINLSCTFDETTNAVKNKDGEYEVTLNNTNKFNITVTAQGKYMIDRVTYIIESDNEKFTAVVDGSNIIMQKVEDGDKDYWTWGGSYTTTRNLVETSTYTVTAEPGTYKFSVYAVQLPE